jgi:hypothetical protein
MYPVSASPLRITRAERSPNGLNLTQSHGTPVKDETGREGVGEACGEQALVEQDQPPIQSSRQGGHGAKVGQQARANARHAASANRREKGHGEAWCDEEGHHAGLEGCQGTNENRTAEEGDWPVRQRDERFFPARDTLDGSGAEGERAEAGTDGGGQ